MPVGVILTVTSAVVATERVAVRVKADPAFSAIDDALLAKVTVGALSFSVIVIVACCVQFSVTLPPETPETEIIAVSFPSYVLSSVGVNDVVPEVAPADIVISETVP